MSRAEEGIVVKDRKNVLGEPLKPCCHAPKAGYFRDGFCRTNQTDRGHHVICAEMTDRFLYFTQMQGNDLSTARPELDFPGLLPGDRWCLCASRWKEAWEAGCAPQVILDACDESALKIVSLEVLKANSIYGCD